MVVRAILLAGVSLALLYGCEPTVPENWKPKQVMGRDLYAPMGGDPDKWPTNMVYATVPWASYGWGERLWINDIKWFNTPMPDSYRHPTPYTIWDVFGPSMKKVPWNYNMPNFKKFCARYPDYPFSLSILDSWFPWFMKRHYDCDRKGFAEFRKQYPNFFGFGVFNELDAGWSANPYAPTTNKAIRAQMEALLPLEYAKDRHTHFKWLDTAFECAESMHFGSKDFCCLYSINPKWAFNVAERGAKMLTCENELFIVGAPWRFGMLATRGASRQFDIPWCWYSAHLIAGYTRDGQKKDGQWALPSKQWPKDEPNVGAAPSLLMRNNFYGYMCGTISLSWEMREHFMNIVDTNGVRRTTVFDEMFDEMYRLHASGFRRGAVWTPLAVLTSADEGMSRHGHNQRNYDPISQNAFLWTLVPTHSNNLMAYADRTKGEQGCLWNSEFGEICDMLCPDTRQKSEDFYKVLKDYPAAILVGWFSRERTATDALVKYVENGGRLYVTQKQIDAGIVPAKIGGKGQLVVIENPIPAAFETAMLKNYWSDKGQGAIAMGKQTFPVYQKVLREVQRDFMPVTVEGDVQWGVNWVEKVGGESRSTVEKVGGESRSTADEIFKSNNTIANRRIEQSKNFHLLVWLINNKGVTRFQGEDEQIDHRFDAKVKITHRKTDKVVEKLIPAGGYTWVEM